MFFVLTTIRSAGPPPQTDCTDTLESIACTEEGVMVGVENEGEVEGESMGRT